jgi:hypothetical protein
MSWIEIIADRKIREAQDEGKFDDLAGKGRPLQLENDRRVPPELRAAYRLMKEAQILPDWIELDREVRRRQEAWSARLETFARRREEEAAALAGRTPGEALQARLDRQRDLFLEQAAAELRALNALIDRLNLIVPTPAQQRLRADLRARVEELEAHFPRFKPHPLGEDAPWRRLVRLDEERPATRLANRMPLRRRSGSIG